MVRKLLISGVVITAVGLALLGYLDPAIRILFFGQAGLGSASSPGAGAVSFTRTGTLASSLLGGRGAAGGATSLVSIATIVVFVATVIGLLLTIAGSFAAGRPMPKGAGPSPAAKSLDR